MSWLGLASNQTISFDNLQDAVDIGYFYALTTIPVPSLEQITKSDANTYVSIDTSYSPYASKSSDQLVVKSNLKPIFQYSGSLYYSVDTPFWAGWSTNSNACNNYSTGLSATVNWNGTLGIGTAVFIPDCTLDLSSLPYYIIYYSGTAYWVTFIDDYYDPTTDTCAYTITDLGSCLTCQTIFLYPANTNPCDHFGSFTQFDTDNALSPTILYVSGGCGTTPVVGGNLWYSQGPGADSYQVDNSGNIISISSC